MKKNAVKTIYGGFILTIVLIALIPPFTSFPIRSPLSDAAFFKLLDVNNTNLTQIRLAANEKDLDYAAELWFTYLKEREWQHFEPIYADTSMIESANQTLNHYFTVLSKTFKLDGEEKIMFGKPWNDINWHDNPLPPNREWIWQLNRFSFISALGSAYLATGDETYAWEYFCILSDWIEDEVPASNPYSWRTLDPAIRVIHITRPFPVFLNSTYATPRVILDITKSLVEQARHLQNNHRKRRSYRKRLYMGDLF